MFIITSRLLRLLIDKNYRYARWTRNKADNPDFNKHITQRWGYPAMEIKFPDSVLLADVRE